MLKAKWNFWTVELPEFWPFKVLTSLKTVSVKILRLSVNRTTSTMPCSKGEIFIDHYCILAPVRNFGYATGFWVNQLKLPSLGSADSIQLVFVVVNVCNSFRWVLMKVFGSWLTKCHIAYLLTLVFSVAQILSAQLHLFDLPQTLVVASSAARWVAALVCT